MSLVMFYSYLFQFGCHHPKELGVPGGAHCAQSKNAKMLWIHLSFRVEYKEGKVSESQSRDHPNQPPSLPLSSTVSHVRGWHNGGGVFLRRVIIIHRAQTGGELIRRVWTRLRLWIAFFTEKNITCTYMMHKHCTIDTNADGFHTLPLAHLFFGNIDVFQRESWCCNKAKFIGRITNLYLIWSKTQRAQRDVVVCSEWAQLDIKKELTTEPQPRRCRFPNQSIIQNIQCSQKSM